MLVKFCLLNTILINKKRHILKDITVDNEIDIFAVTKAWLHHDDTFSVLKSVQEDTIFIISQGKTPEVEGLVCY